MFAVTNRTVYEVGSVYEVKGLSLGQTAGHTAASTGSSGNVQNLALRIHHHCRYALLYTF